MEITDYNWNASIASILTAAGVDDVSAAGEINDAGKLVLTVTTKDGKTSTMTLEPPELDEATSELTDEGKELLAQKLSELCGRNITLDQALSNPTIASLFFDLAEVMKLMQEIAQEQKKNLTLQRENEMTIELESIQSQAAEQRNAAKASLITSCVSMVMQIASIAVSIGVTASATKSQSKAMSEAGLDTAKTDLKMAMDSAKSPEAATQYANETRNALTEEQQGQLNTAFGEVDVAQQALTDAQHVEEGQLVDQDQVQAAEDTLVEKLNAACEKADQDVMLARNELESAKGKLAGIEDVNSQEYTNAQQQVTAAETKVKNAEKMQLAVHANASTVKHDCGLTASLNADVVKARNAFDTLEQHVEMSDTWRNAVKTQRQIGYLDQAIAALKSVLDGVSGMVKSEHEAKATEKSAEQKESEVRYSELSDVMKSSQDIIAAVLQMYQEIMQAESQSLEQIIRA